MYFNSIAKHDPPIFKTVQCCSKDSQFSRLVNVVNGIKKKLIIIKIMLKIMYSNQNNITTSSFLKILDPRTPLMNFKMKRHIIYWNMTGADL